MKTWRRRRSSQRSNRCTVVLVGNTESQQRKAAQHGDAADNRRALVSSYATVTAAPLAAHRQAVSRP